MAHTEEYKTVIKLNSDQAQKEIDKLEKKVADLRKSQADYKTDSVKYKNLQKEIDKTMSKLGTMKNRVKSVEDALKNMSNATPKQLKATIKDINALLNSGDIKRGSREWDSLTVALKQANTELGKIKAETKASQPVLSKFFKFLNDSWGGIFVLVQSISGISTTIRKSVEDYAKMEEEMADVRKYTGMTADQVSDLNEELKRMDTRTSREQLNQLAGSAGRLGLQSKKDILEFVEAADMIGVALGDDLGDGAVDKIGKLAMAFGEDDNMGLKKAMLSTGSALNELAQNSSAQAGYLVEFTARVAGFGKQLGLTQAQIMGFGTVMDENLLKDEMAATAFGNMLTKMQTDTAKFAKIAGKDVKEFSDLLRRDANSAILALADSLKAADPQNMMKMLDDMGLDGSRAVGVLSTLADKIDDVRKHQARATEAYAKATSVQGEFNTMNNTVQARLDKCKKQFKEMSVELGERLLPLVRYTITGASMLAKSLSVLTGFVYDNWKALAVLSAQVATLTVLWKAHSIWLAIIDARNKAVAFSTAALTAAQNLLRSAGVALHAMWALLTKGVAGYTVVMRAARLASITQPWAALATVLSVVGVAIYGVVKAWKSHSEAVKSNLQQVKEMRAQQQLEADLNKKVSESIVDQKTKVEQLSRIVHSNAYTIDERRAAIKKLQDIVPDYHAAITNEGKLYNDNSTAIKQYIQDLNDAALAEAVYQKKVEINRKKMELNFKQNRIENSLKAVQAYRDTQQQVTEELVYENGSVVKKQHKTKSAEESDRQQKRHEQRLAEVKSETKVVEAEEKYIDKVLEKNKKVNELFTKKVTTSTTPPVVPEPVKTPEPYKSDGDEKKEETERKKKAAEERKALLEQSKQLKAEMENRLAEESLSYSMGLTNYRDYIEKRRQIQLEGIRQRKALFTEGSAEYLRLDAEEKKVLLHGDDEQRKLELKEYERMHKDLLLELESAFNTEGSAIYKNEAAYREARFQEEMDFLENKKKLTSDGSLEQMQIEWEIEDRNKEHKMQREREYMTQLSKYREEVGRTDYDRLQQIELAGAESLYNALLADGKMTKDEYDAIIEHIRRKYAGLKAEQAASTDIQAKASASLDTAKKNAGVKDMSAGDNAATGIFSISEAVRNQKLINAQLQELYGEDYENNREYQEAKRQLDQETMQQIVAGAQAAYQTIGQFMSAASAYSQACSDLEVAKITANYDKQIEAAGNNTKKKEKLEKERDKKIADAKTKANKKAMIMEMAQAVAQSAMGAISAYSSTMAGAPYPANLVLAPISAGIALAAGALQIATIKKQHQAEEVGYYEGGFTGGRRYRREAGVVHEGEFVANHKAVENPNILPFLTFLDQAQRNNSVGSLSAQDVSRSMGAGTSQLLAPIVNVNVDNERLNDSIDRINENQDRLASKLEQGIGVDIPIDGENGLYRRMKRYEDLLKKK
jgi:TP901 family phage tail tape measure protein